MSRIRSTRLRHTLTQTLSQVLVLAGALLIALIAFRLPVEGSLRLLYEGAFGDRFAWSRMAVKATPLLLTGLGMVVAWRAGVYNIGGEGQFVIGGVFGAWLAKSLMFGVPHMPRFLFLSLVTSACILGGAAWAWLAGWLQVRRGVQVVISTILLNFVAIQVLGWAVSGPLQQSDHKLPLTDQIPDELMLPKLNPQMDLHLGVALSVVVAFGVFAYLYASKSGFKLRLSGSNPRVARANRINSDQVQVRALMLSGALCGLAGAIEYTGMSGQLGTEFSQQWGFLGIPVALLGGLHPLGVIASASYFGALFAGSENLARYTPAGTTLIYVIQSSAVLAFVGIQSLRERRLVSRGDD